MTDNQKFSVTSRASIILAVVMMLASCRESLTTMEPVGSGFSQLTKTDYNCRTWDAARIERTKQLVSPFSRNFDGSPLEGKYYQAMAGLPDHYLQYLAEHGKKRRFFVSLENPGFQGGVTQFDGNGPNWIKIHPSAAAVDFATQHEVGHAVQLYIGQEAAKRGFSEAIFEKDVNSTSQVECNNPNINSYPISYGCSSPEYYYEFFAEAYNSYYCKEDTKAMVKEQFPATYAMLQKYLEPPVWEATTGDIPGTAPAGLALHLDSDVSGDGNAFNAFIAADANIDSAAFCLGSLADCQQTGRRDIETKRVQATSTSRRVFMANAPVPISATTVITLLGFDANGTVTSAKARTFRAK